MAHLWCQVRWRLQLRVAPLSALESFPKSGLEKWQQMVFHLNLECWSMLEYNFKMVGWCRMSHPKGSESERGKSQSVRSVAWQQIHCDNDPVQIQCTLPVACCSPTFLVISVASAISLHTYIYIYKYIYMYTHPDFYMWNFQNFPCGGSFWPTTAWSSVTWHRGYLPTWGAHKTGENPGEWDLTE